MNKGEEVEEEEEEGEAVERRQGVENLYLYVEETVRYLPSIDPGSGEIMGPRVVRSYYL